MADEPERRDPERKTWAQVARYSELGFLLPATTFAGWLIGAGLDKWLGTKWLTLTGVVFGIVAGFVQLFRIIFRNEKLP